MTRVLVITDSSGCASADPDANLRVLPITILVTGGEHTDSPEVADAVYEALDAERPVRSLPPSTHDYVKAIEDGDFDAAVVITPAREFTVMHRNAELAARLVDRPVQVIDCRTAAAAQGLIVLEALQAAHRRRSLAGVAEVVNDCARRAALIAMLPSLTAAQRNARLPAEAPGRVGDGAPGLFRFHNGSVSHIADVLPGADPVEAISQAWYSAGGSPSARSLVFHAAEQAMAETLADRLGGDPGIVPFSPAMAIHTGPGWLGVAWLQER
jgi:fatty acid-binding protein DegV